MSAAIDSFTALRDAYHDRFAHARAAKRAGKPVVGVIGKIAPVELIEAAGAFPLTIAGAERHPTPRAARYMPASYDWEFHSIYQHALAGTFDLCDLLVITRACERLYYFLKEPYRRGEAPGLPPLYVCDLIPTRRPSFEAYNRGQLAAFRARLERLSGKPIDQPALVSAIAEANGVRRLRGDLAGRRRAGDIDGVEGMIAAGSGYFMSAADYRQALGAHLLSPKPKRPGRTRLLVLPTQPLHHLALHEILEGEGAVVTAEDDWWGARAGEGVVDEALPPMEALLDAYIRRTPSVNVSPKSEREAWFRRTAGEGDFDGVVFFAPANDAAFGWDYPSLKAAAGAAGLRSLLLRDDVLAPEGRARAAEAVRAFLSGGDR